MTPTERTELLRAVARVAPEGMGVEWVKFEPEYISQTEPTERLVFKGTFVSADAGIGSKGFHQWDGGHAFLGLEDDANDAAACFAMLDAMEGKVGAVTITGPYPQPRGEYYVKWTTRDNSGRQHGHGVHDETRAIAVARAFVAVFGVPE